MVVQMTAGKYNGGADALFFGIVESLVGFRCSDNFPMLMVMFHMPVVVQWRTTDCAHGSSFSLPPGSCRIKSAF
jgi:hypothetical protein